MGFNSAFKGLIYSKFSCKDGKVFLSGSPLHFFRRFIAQRVFTVYRRINYEIVPVTNLNKYLHYGTNGTE